MHVALLRGINLAARNRLLMKDLIEIFLAAGCTDVTTYIQSGNVMFNAPAATRRKLPEIVSAQIAARFGFKIPVVVRDSEQLRQTLANNPFLQAGEPEKTLHVLFLAHVPNPLAIAALDPQRSAPDRFHVREGDIYLHLPNRVSDSKLTNAYFDSKLSTVSTARNWATVSKLFELMSQAKPPKK